MRRVLKSIYILFFFLAVGTAAWLLFERYAEKKGIPLRQVEIPGTDYHVKLPRAMGPEPVSKTIYLNREGAWLFSGADEAPRNRSSIVLNAKLEKVKIPAFTGSYRGWQAIVRCIRGKLAPFDVEVVDTRPVDRDYIMALFGGHSSLVGHSPKSKKSLIGGLSPFSGGSIASAVVMIFSQALRNNTRKVCEVAAQEIGHAYGLDHAYNCRDVMTYLRRCSKSRGFVDKEVACGEHKPRNCKHGDPKQNTYRYLLQLLGPKPKAPEPLPKKRASR